MFLASIGQDTIITIESKQPEASAFQSSPDTVGGSGTPALQHAVGQGIVTTSTGGRSLDIVKSIVYGGLLELITSLSVVSSAVGADSATGKQYLSPFLFMKNDF